MALIKSPTGKTVQQTIIKVWMWFLVVISVFVALTYMPSFTSLLFILFIAIAIPLEPVRAFWGRLKIHGRLKGVLLVILFFVALSNAPAKPKADENETLNEPPKESASVEDDRNSEDRMIEAQPEDDEPEEASPSPTLKINSNFDTTDYLKISPEVLFEYGGYMEGEKIVTVITLKDVDSNTLKADTDNNNSSFSSIICRFDDKGLDEVLNEGDVVTVAGTVQEHNSLEDTFDFLSTPTATLENCSIIGFGEISENLKAGIDEQRQIGEQMKKTYEDAIAAAKKAEKDDYISQCSTVSHSDVARNPDSYDGQKIKISGDVVQVSEGWFNSVTLRVSSNGDMWYVTYTREDGESRILEGDRITGYGECTGVKTYTTVLGAQVTIPGMSMEYYD